ncbi:unnamed protein product, partial [Vitis vinifera]
MAASASASAVDLAPNPSSVDGLLWWDSFSLLLTELESVSPSSDLPPFLVKKVKDNHAWFVDMFSLFKPPNKKSREALDSKQVKIGTRQLTVQPELKEAALKVSNSLCLDEVQSYLLVERFVEHNNVAVNLMVQEFLHVILFQYYIERQCLLKCTRQIFMHALYVGSGSEEGNAIRQEAQSLISDGLESKLLSVLHDLLSSSHPEHMDIDLFTLWAEETLIEDNLILDILFLAYYESFCVCNGAQWKKLCLLYKGIISGSFNFGKLAISPEATHSFYHAKVQLLLILIETLDLENLLQLIHDEMPFREGCTLFSLTDVQEIDAIISGFNAFETKEAGPLILTWAVFLCLISSLPGKQENSVLMDIDHVGYVRQAFEAASLSYFLELLQSDILKDSDGPVAGYRSVLRTFVSAFIASYEINVQLEDNTLKLILDILCKIYRGEESLCNQFWDRESFVDGPIRCLLCNLEGEFPIRTVELVGFLSALCEGTWPAECVYNFLDKSVGISSLLEITSDSLVDNISQIIETRVPLHVPGVEGLIIPSQTRGHVLKVIDGNTALVRWEYTQSGVLVLLLRLAQRLYLDCNEEVLVTLDLLCRLVSFNTAVSFALMDIGNSLHVQATRMNAHMEMQVNMVEIICTLIRNLSPNWSSSSMMAMGVSILEKMLKWIPLDMKNRSFLFGILKIIFLNKKQTYLIWLLRQVHLKLSLLVQQGEILHGSWLLSGKLAKMLLIDCEQNDNCCQLTISGILNNIFLNFVVTLLSFLLHFYFFSSGKFLRQIPYVLVNHEYWKYKVKHVRWKVTLKVLEVMKKCIMTIPYSQKVGEIVQDILLRDSSIHNALFRIICTTKQALEKLYMSRLCEAMEIEGLELAICSVFDILFTMLSKLSKDITSSLPVFDQAVLSTTTKPISVIAAVISLISYFHNPRIQVGASRVLSMLFIIADSSQPYLFGNRCFGLDDKQITDLRHSIDKILSDQSSWNEDLFVATVKLLTSAALHQPAFLVAIIAAKDNLGLKQPVNEASFGTLGSVKPSLVDALLQVIERSDDLINSNPRLLLNVLNLLKALWQGAAQYADILEWLKNSEKFWKLFCNSISLIARMKAPLPENLTEMEALSLAYKYQCQTAVLEIMAEDLFLQKKLLHAEFLVKLAAESSKEKTGTTVGLEKSRSENLHHLKDVLSSWCENSVLVDLIKSYASCQYDTEIYLRAKIAASLFIVHVMGKLATGDAGSLSVSLLEKLHSMNKKLGNQPAFSELLSQYSQRGYSEGKELNILILSDLYYHLQGELKGRKIDPGPFKELAQYLLDSQFLQNYRHEYDGDLFAPAKDVHLFDTSHLQADLGLAMWDHSQWKATKEIAETMLLCMKEANSMVLLTGSKLCSLKALITILTMYEEDLSERKTTIGGAIPEQLILSCIDHVCQCFHGTLESLAPVLDAPEDMLDFLAAQAELLLRLIRFVNKSLPLPVCVLVLKTSGHGLKVLGNFKPSVPEVRTTMKLLLMLLLSSLEFSSLSSLLGGLSDKKSVEDLAEASSVSLGLLPILCNCIGTAENCVLSLTTIDLILKGFLTPNTWFPIIQEHLQLQHIVLKLQDKSSLASIPIILRFLLTLARPQHVWGLGLAVVTAIIHSLGGSSLCVNTVENVIPYFFSEKAYLISYYLNAPDFPSDDHDKKRARAQRTRTSLAALKETEHTLMLMCVLAKHWNSWVKAVKEMDTELRERSIHLLAFISRGTQRHGESPSRIPPLLCPPMLKEDFDFYKKPAFVNSQNGWFALSPRGCLSKSKFSSVSIKSTALVVKDQSSENLDVSQTHFSDIVALQIYRITFLLLKFLCLQAEGAARRAEEVGFVDLAHFPELPMPEILHGLQDQAIAIVTELCEANKLKKIEPEVQSTCLLLLQIMEMALYLEQCVSQICGIRPVLGRVEDFSKEVVLLIRATEGHSFLKAAVKSLKQIISLVYPGLLQTEGLL